MGDAGVPQKTNPLERHQDLRRGVGHGFLPEPQKFASGDDVEVIGRGMKLLKLATGAQARARHESWKKRQVQLPRDVMPGAAADIAEIAALPPFDQPCNPMRSGMTSGCERKYASAP